MAGKFPDSEKPSDIPGEIDSKIKILEEILKQGTLIAPNDGVRILQVGQGKEPTTPKPED